MNASLMNEDFYSEYKHQIKHLNENLSELTDLVNDITSAYAAEFLTKFQYLRLLTLLYTRLVIIEVFHH